MVILGNVRFSSLSVFNKIKILSAGNMSRINSRNDSNQDKFDCFINVVVIALYKFCVSVLLFHFFLMAFICGEFNSFPIIKE